MAFLGTGDDTFQWDPGDGSDTVEGQGGFDALVFNGSGAAEIMDLAANGGRARFTRNVGGIVMDLNDVEALTINAGGGVDAITVNDMSGTDVVEVDINLAGIPGGAGGDAQPDTVVVNGTNGNNVVDVFGSGTSVSVVGLPALVTVVNSEGANDTLVINGLGGDDVIEASGLSGLLLTGDGGNGDDVLIGGAGADALNGGAGDDVLLGGPGIDILDGGPGDNVVIQGFSASPSGFVI